MTNSTMAFLIFEGRGPDGRRDCRGIGVWVEPRECFDAARALASLGAPYIALMDLDSGRWSWNAPEPQRPPSLGRYAEQLRDAGRGHLVGDR